METPRKAPRFAVLESSLLARKGQARPAIPPGADHDEAVTRADAIADAEAHHNPGFEHNLGELIIRPSRHNEAAAAAIHGEHSGESDQPAPANSQFYDPEPSPDGPSAPVTYVAPPAFRAVPDEPEQSSRRTGARQPREKASVEPRGLDREQAAQYIGLSRAAFARLVEEDILPDALPFGRRRVWDRRALDKALDHLSGIEKPEDKAE